MTQADAFTGSFDDFNRFLDPSVYTPLPEDWVIGLTDVVGSTKVIAAGGYKAVNMAGASAIAAVSNVVADRGFPFVFGGDGASFAIPPSDRAAAASALARTCAWAKAELGLTLRAALIPLADIRAAGADVRVARYRVSDAVTYAMFSGGGLRWAEAALKAGRFAIEPDAAEVPPRLDGLSCRWNHVPARRGVILSLIVESLPGADQGAFSDLARRILAVFDEDPRHGHPVPEEGPGVSWPPPGLRLEVKAQRRGGAVWLKTLAIGAETLLAFLFVWTSKRVFKADPGDYRRYLTLNTDFRKFDDALRLTVDASEAQVSRVEAMLNAARGGGIVRFGLHRQTEAMMTCFVPAAGQKDHIHFLDGADGGYARAAQAMKSGGA